MSVPITQGTLSANLTPSEGPLVYVDGHKYTIAEVEAILRDHAKRDKFYSAHRSAVLEISMLPSPVEEHGKFWIDFDCKEPICGWASVEHLYVMLCDGRRIFDDILIPPNTLPHKGNLVHRIGPFARPTWDARMQLHLDLANQDGVAIPLDVWAVVWYDDPPREVKTVS